MTVDSENLKFRGARCASVDKRVTKNWSTSPTSLYNSTENHTSMQRPAPFIQGGLDTLVQAAQFLDHHLMLSGTTPLSPESGKMLIDTSPSMKSDHDCFLSPQITEPLFLPSTPSSPLSPPITSRSSSRHASLISTSKSRHWRTVLSPNDSSEEPYLKGEPRGQSTSLTPPIKPASRKIMTKREHLKKVKQSIQMENLQSKPRLSRVKGRVNMTYKGRKAYLEHEGSCAKIVDDRRIFCLGCKQEVLLDNRRAALYLDAWLKHRDRCSGIRLKYRLMMYFMDENRSPISKSRNQENFRHMIDDYGKDNASQLKFSMKPYSWKLDVESCKQLYTFSNEDALLPRALE